MALVRSEKLVRCLQIYKTNGSKGERVYTWRICLGVVLYVLELGCDPL